MNSEEEQSGSKSLTEWNIWQHLSQLKNVFLFLLEIPIKLKKHLLPPQSAPDCIKNTIKNGFTFTN